MSSILSRVFFNFAGKWGRGGGGSRRGSANDNARTQDAGRRMQGVQQRKQDAGNMLAAKIKRGKKQSSINTG